MRRIASTPRPSWQQRVEEAGLAWHTSQQPYWNESAFYQFTAQEVASLEAATNELEAMTLRAVEHVIENKLYARMNVPAMAAPLIEASWHAEPPSLYGRFDLAYDGAIRPSCWSTTPTRPPLCWKRPWCSGIGSRTPSRGATNSIRCTSA